MRSPMPVLFISHGSPMHAIEATEPAVAWAGVPATIPAPAAIVMVSAHWTTGIPLIGGSTQPETIHDFGGFPQELYQIQYPAAGSPTVARRIHAQLAAAGTQAGIDGTRGLDHGAWVPLLHMFPKADIPVVQVSVQPQRDAAHHLAVGRALAPLREEGILIIGSGHMTHNLRDFFQAPRGRTTAEYAVAFRDWVDERVRTHKLDELLQWEFHAPGASRAHPTSEHFLPLFVALGAAGTGYRTTRICDGFDGGVLAMDAYRFD